MAQQLTEPAAATHDSFPFLQLPPETQIKILEHTDLVAPNQCIKWDPRQKFHIPPGSIKSWQPSTSLFLVSKSFYLQAMEVFWKQNNFQVGPDTKPLYEIIKPGERSTMPQLFAASEFLSQVIPSGSLRYLRSLDLQMFGISDRQALSDAQNDWFCTLKHLQSQKDLKLNFLNVSGGWNCGPTRETWETTPMGETISTMRKFINEHIWPLEGENKPPFFLQQLLVEVKDDGAHARYNIRRKGQHIPKSYSASAWGFPCESRVISQEDRPSCTGPASGNHNTEKEEWVEEAWVRMIHRTEY